MNLVLYFILMIFTSNSQPEVEKKTIIFYGDSINAGYGVGNEFAFPHIVPAQVDKNDFDDEVINAELRVATSAGSITRIDWSVNSAFDVLDIIL